MQDRANFEDDSVLKGFLADQLLNGRLAIAMGAGASMGFGLPNWTTLIENTYRIKSLTPQPGLKPEEAAEHLLVTGCLNNEIEFARTVQSALYSGYKTTMDSLKKNDLLSSIGALVMASGRGSVTRVVSFNFDDLVEVYLRYYGVDVESISKMPQWDSRSDVRVFHPHGLLESPPGKPAGDGIVLAQAHYDRIVGKQHLPWRSVLLDVFRSNTTLFIGLSGADTNLTSILSEAKEGHASTILGDAFWGVRFSDDVNDPRRGMWETRGVYQATVGNYSEIPAWLIEICQGAATIRNARRSR